MTKYTNNRLVISGNTIESYHYCDRPLFSGLTNSRYRRVGHESIDSEESKRRKKDSRRKSAQRANIRSRRIVNSNAWKWLDRDGKMCSPIFVTLTFRDGVCNIQIANTIFSRFIKRLNYALSGTKKSFIKYFASIELHNDNCGRAVHYHVIFFNISSSQSRTIAENWTAGFVKTKKNIQSVGNLAGYITKYSHEHLEDQRFNGKKKYFASRGLLKPIEVFDQNNAQSIEGLIPRGHITERRTFGSVYRGRVEYIKYELSEGQSIFDVIPGLNRLL